jgi:ABC-2 type transport system permease protein
MANSVHPVWDNFVATKEMAIAPYPYPRLTGARALRQFLTVISMLLAEYREIWFFNVFMGFIIPFGFIFFLKSTGDTITPARAIFLVGGNMATSIALSPTTFLIAKLGWAKQNQEFDYWISLPLPKLTLVFGIMTVALLFSLPGLLGVYIFGHLLFHLPYTNDFVLILLIPLCIFPLAGLGMLLGTYAPNGQAANLLSNLLIVFVGFLSPMMIPSEDLPVPFHIISWFVPTTYVADIFRIVLAGQLTTQFFTDIGVLVAFSIILLPLAYKRIEWRTV